MSLQFEEILIHRKCIPQTKQSIAQYIVSGNNNRGPGGHYDPQLVKHSEWVSEWVVITIPSNTGLKNVH